MAKLTAEDIADLRAYEREREAFRAHVIEVKRRRRVGIGPIITMVFENRDTIRFQIQEMARVEKLITDEAIQDELDVYNPLIPEPGELSATLFVELTTKELLQEWLPRLVGIERAPRLRFGGVELAALPEPSHQAQLTRDDVTACVHYVHFVLSPDQVAAFADGPVELAIDHPAYQAATTLAPETVASLLEDLRGTAV